jgi:hypothetical protein
LDALESADGFEGDFTKTITNAERTAKGARDVRNL